MRNVNFVVLASLLGLSACAAGTGVPAGTASAGCQRLRDVSRAVSALYASGDVYSAREAKQRPPAGRPGLYTRTLGADVYVHATEGTSREYLERTLVCHAAYGQAVHPNDPLHPTRGSVETVNVRSAGSGYAVRIQGSDRTTTQEIVTRTHALTRPAAVTVEQVGNLEPGDERL